MSATAVPVRPRRANVVGTGLIGGSVGLALRRQGWRVTGDDRDPCRAARALELGALDTVGRDPEAEITFVATPVGAIPGAVEAALASGPGLVTDVGSVKATVAAAIDDPRFLGGHPMAGSEQEGVDGSDAALFRGAVWVLTPTASSSDRTYAAVHAVVSSFGADVVALSPTRHDALVAIVSHVPHLTAATLMRLADDRSEEHRAVLRLAAGGFRDMTRIAAGHPAIWPDICCENRSAIVETLDRLLDALGELRSLVADGDRDALLGLLERARVARTNLPSRLSAKAGRDRDLVEVRVPVPDRPGVLADVTTLAGELDVNIADLEIAHSSEGNAGVVILLVEAEPAGRLVPALVARGYRPSRQAIG